MRLRTLKLMLMYQQIATVLHGRACVPWGCMHEKRPCCTGCRQTSSLLYERACVSSGDLPQRKLCRTGCRQTSSLLYGRACVFWDYVWERVCVLRLCMGESVSFELTWIRKCFITLIAGKHLLSCMGEVVFLEATCHRGPAPLYSYPETDLPRGISS